MQQMQDRPPAMTAEPSRRRPPRRRAPAPVTVPEVPSRPLPARTVKLQEVLAGHQRAVDARIEQGLRDMHRFAQEAIRRVAAEGIRAAGKPTGGNGAARMLAQGEELRGILTHAEERFQAITQRLQGMENAIRALAKSQRETLRPTDERVARTLLQRTEVLARAFAAVRSEHRQALERLTASNERAIARLRAEQREALRQLAADQRAAMVEMAGRTGRGVVAVARRLQEDIERRIESISSGPAGASEPRPRP